MIIADYKLNIQYKTYLKENFNTSIIIPLTKNVDLFLVMMRQNLIFFQRNGIEIIIIISQKISKVEVLNFIKNSPLVNWKIFHFGSSTLAELINLGILKSSKDFILVLPSCIVMNADVIYALRYQCEYYKTSYAFCKIKLKNTTAADHKLLLVNKKFVLRVNLINDELYSWQDIHNNIVKKLESIKVTKIFVDEVVADSIDDSHFTVLDDDDNLSLNYKKPRIPKKHHTADAKLLYDWACNKYAKKLCSSYLSKFEDFKIPNRLSFSKKFPLIALIQTRNEINNIKDVLSNLEGYVDGIILLDDGSTDDTYETAESPKLLIKVRKRFVNFNDLENRNNLLDIVSFIQASWLLFIDADERFDPNFGNPRQFLDKEGVETVGFNLINVSKTRKSFITNLVDTNPNSKNGILCRWRMFKNIGRAQIHNDKTLHFRTIPYLTNVHTSNILVHHLVKIDKKSRKSKYNFYKENDPNFEHNIRKGIYDTIIVTPIFKTIVSIKLQPQKKIL